MIYLFSEEAHEGVDHLPLIRIRFVPFECDLSSYDAFVFSSKNGVKALALKDDLWQQKELYAIGSGTASYIEKFGVKAVFTCQQSYGDTFAQEIAPFLRHKRVLFPRAKEVSSSLYTLLKDADILIDEVVVYETTCQNYPPEQAPQEYARLIFTSPSTVRCFLKNFPWKASYQAIVIGTKTAAALPKGAVYHLCEKQSIEACITLAKAI